MINLITDKLNLNISLDNRQEYNHCVSDVSCSEILRGLDNFTHHYHVTRLEHCLHVSYLSFVVCKRLGLDYRSAARGGLLHDFYFYDSRVTKPAQGIHCLRHPGIALANAEKHFPLNKVERDIIAKHMWPVTVTPPRYRESYVVTALDKYCANRELALGKLILRPAV
ncbi:MAG: HD family phosphohydrolase [Syntrophomonadaceae bacterium]